MYLDSEAEEVAESMKECVAAAYEEFSFRQRILQPLQWSKLRGATAAYEDMTASGIGGGGGAGTDSTNESNDSDESSVDDSWEQVVYGPFGGPIGQLLGGHFSLGRFLLDFNQNPRVRSDSDEMDDSALAHQISEVTISSPRSSFLQASLARKP